jgi:hypothetical protein
MAGGVASRPFGTDDGQEIKAVPHLEYTQRATFACPGQLYDHIHRTVQPGRVFFVLRWRDDWTK